MKNINNAPSKLLIIINALSMGGAEHMVYELVSNINKYNFQIELLCYGKKQGNVLEEKISNVCKVHYLGITGKINLKAIRKVFFVISKINPDIIHAHQGGVTFALPWCTIHNVPLCITVHSKPEQAFSKLNNIMIKKLKNLLKLSIIAVSKQNLSYVQSYYKVNSKNSNFINNGIDINRFEKKAHEKFVFINVARHDENKNQKSIINCFIRLCKEFSNIQLILVGDGPIHNDLIQMVSDYGDEEKILFTGLVGDPAPYYAVSDVYVQASHREAMPLSVLEAMATGLPIISTDVGGLKDVIKGNGILVPDYNENELYNALKYILLNKSNVYSKMSIKSKEIVKNYSSEKMAHEYEKIYKQLLS